MPPNYNHWFFLEVNRRRRRTPSITCRARPLDYASHRSGRPEGHVHALDRVASARQDRRDLLTASTARCSVATRPSTIASCTAFPLPPVGLYAFLPLVVLWTFQRAWSLTRTGDPDATARGALLFFCLFQIAFVVAASSLFTFRESARYRYQIESMIWVITALWWRSLAVAWLAGSPRAALSDVSIRSGAGPTLLRSSYARLRRVRRGRTTWRHPSRGVGPWRSSIGEARFTTSKIRSPSSYGACREGPKRPAVVDLGCGVGASFRYLAERLAIRGTGITLSPVQAQLATSLIRDAGLSDCVVCLEGDYCDLPPGLGPADLAYAIESFVHAPEPTRFIDQCRRLVRPGGMLAICDDFREPSADPGRSARSSSSARVGTSTRCSMLEELKALARAAGFEHGRQLDLSPYLEIHRVRDRVVGALLSLLGWLPSVRTRFDYLVGGRPSDLPRRGWIRYELVVFRRLG